LITPGDRGDRRPRGWSVLQAASGIGALTRDRDRYLRDIWVSRRHGFYRLALAGLAIWGGYNLIGSGSGFLRLRELHRQEIALRARCADLAAETRQLRRELSEDPVLSAERGIREKYRRSRPNEIIYQIERSPDPVGSDSTAVGPGTGSGARED
jgi:cell division protein FtsB